MSIDVAYREAIDLSSTHYENFPVASFLIRKDLRKEVAIIYWFARTADDIADEGRYSAEERYAMLDEFESRFDQLLLGNTANQTENSLRETITSRNLTPDHFKNLLSAFRQDITKNRYTDFADVIDYCRRSANPVGRLILELHDIRNNAAFNYSDSICTALQLTNFYQDTGIDYQRGRIYIPVDEMSRFGVSESDFSGTSTPENLRKLLEFNINRNKEFYREGRKLIPFLNTRLKFEIKWTILGGEAILHKIEKNKFNVLKTRPALKKTDFVKLFIKSLL